MNIIEPKQENRERSIWYGPYIAEHSGYRLITRGMTYGHFFTKDWESRELYDEDVIHISKFMGCTDLSIDIIFRFSGENWFEIVNAQDTILCTDDIETWTQGITLLEEIANGLHPELDEVQK